MAMQQPISAPLSQNTKSTTNPIAAAPVPLRKKDLAHLLNAPRTPGQIIRKAPAEVHPEPIALRVSTLPAMASGLATSGAIPGEQVANAPCSSPQLPETSQVTLQPHTHHPLSPPNATPKEITPRSSFSDAAAAWMVFRRIEGASKTLPSGGYIKKNTEKSYDQYLRSLSLFFGEKRLDEITSHDLRMYQRARLLGEGPFVRSRRPHEAPAPCPAGSKKVNQEIQALTRILKRANCWSEELLNNHQNLQVDDTDAPRALSPEEQQHWLDVSRIKERWLVIHWYSIVAFQTTFGTNEMRGLRLGDINLAQGVVSVPVKSAKNKRRARTVPLTTPGIRWALEKLIERAYKCGCSDPQHYLFPLRERGKRMCGEGYDPGRPMTESGIKKLWDEVRVASGLRAFRMYDTRHTAITRMSEAGMPAPVIEDYAGHVSAKMRRHYTHISEQARRTWGAWAFGNQAQPTHSSTGGPHFQASPSRSPYFDTSAGHQPFDTQPPHSYPHQAQQDRGPWEHHTQLAAPSQLSYPQLPYPQTGQYPAQDAGRYGYADHPPEQRFRPGGNLVVLPWRTRPKPISLARA